MNLILFALDDLHRPLPPSDARFQHITEILGLQPGDRFRCGLEEGPTGEAVWFGAGRWTLLSWDADPSPGLYPLNLIIGTPRPPTARRLVKDLCTLGLAQVCFSATELGEKSYLSSRLWTEGDAEDALREGAMQAQSTRLTRLRLCLRWREALQSASGLSWRLLLDPGQPEPLATAQPPEAWLPNQGLCIALGPERGLSPRERQTALDLGFQPVSMGPRILRTETAALSAAAMLLSRWYW